jgi:hypothetical protein
MSLPRTWKAATLDGLNLDAVLAAPKPTPAAYQTVVRDGVTQDANGNWVQNWDIAWMFSDTTDEDGVTTTKAEHETAYQASVDAGAAERNRNKRDSLLAETDWTGMSDVTMTSAMTTYRQALRDITDHSNWPNLDEADWPTKL